MKFTNELEIKIGEDGLVMVREPSTAEWNAYKAEALHLGRHNRLRDNSESARAGLFDKIVVRVENLSDDAGEITVKELGRIPLRIKSQVVFQAFEGEEINVKN